MSSKKKKKGLFGYISSKDIKAWKKRGEKPARIKMGLACIEMNKEIVKKRKNNPLFLA